jgi:hypothetical protein
MDSFGPGSKSKPCSKFFSTTGCSFGDGCHFLHYVPGGYKAVSQLSNLGGPAARKPIHPPPFSDGGPAQQSPKTKLCNRINTPEGCKYGDKCRFAHSDVSNNSGGGGYGGSYGSGGGGGYGGGSYGQQPYQPPYEQPAPSNFGASATAKISIDAALAGAVIGKGGVHSKQICRVTGVKLAVRDHETDQSQKNIELEGSFDQIKEASSMVRELIMSLGSAGGGGGGGGGPPAGFPQARQFGGGPPSGGAAPGSNFKTKECEKFAKGACTFGDRCHFAHGAHELRRTVA